MGWDRGLQTPGAGFHFRSDHHIACVGRKTVSLLFYLIFLFSYNEESGCYGIATVSGGSWNLPFSHRPIARRYVMAACQKETLEVMLVSVYADSRRTGVTMHAYFRRILAVSMRRCLREASTRTAMKLCFLPALG